MRIPRGGERPSIVRVSRATHSRGVAAHDRQSCAAITNTAIAIQETRMSEHENNELRPEDNADGVDRRGFLKCMAWAGTGAFFQMEGGVLKSYSLSRMPRLERPSAGGLSFVQI